MQRFGRAGGRAFRSVALPDGSDPEFLPVASGPIRTWQADLADRNRGRSMRGNRWAVTFLDTFRYLDQLGRLAKAGVQVVMHNTLAASDYGLLDQRTLAPRPNYWGALLWRQLMGTTVLESGVPIQPGLHVYAHCRREAPDGVTLLV